MYKTNITFEHKMKINDIIELKNKNNEKSIYCKVVDIEFDIAPFEIVSTNDSIKNTCYNNKMISYKVFYTTISLCGSYYDTIEIKEFPNGNTLVLNLE